MVLLLCTIISLRRGRHNKLVQAPEKWPALLLLLLQQTWWGRFRNCHGSPEIHERMNEMSNLRNRKI